MSSNGEDNSWKDPFEEMDRMREEEKKKQQEFIIQQQKNSLDWERRMSKKRMNNLEAYRENQNDPD